MTLVLNYVLLFPVVLLRDNLDHPVTSVLAFYAPQLAMYSPVLIAMVVVRCLNPERGPGPVALRRIVFRVVWLVALVVFVLKAEYERADAGIGLEALLVWSPPIALLPAFVVSSALGRFAGVSMNSMNVLEEAIPATTASFTIIMLFAIYAVVSDRMWRRLPADSTSALGWTKQSAPTAAARPEPAVTWVCFG